MKDVCPCKEYNPDSLVALSEGKHITFGNGIRLNPCSTDLLQNLLFPQPVKVMPALKEPEDSSPCSKQPTTCADPKPSQLGLEPPILFLEDQIQ